LTYLIPWLKQFRERYKGYKIPLENLVSANSSLVKQIAAVGTRIKAPRSQAHVLGPLKHIIEFTDDEETTIIESATKGAAAAEKGQLQDEEKLLEALTEGEEEEVEVEEIIPSKRQANARAKAAAEAVSLLAGKVVNLTDLLPPVPDKGTFEVESIKESQYFFS